MNSQLVIASKLNKSNRFTIRTHIMINSRINELMFLIDTGSEITSTNSKLLDKDLNEAVCIARMYETKLVTGIFKNPDATIKYYRIPLDILIFSDMHIKNSYVWVTFNDNVTDSVLRYGYS